MGWIRGDAQIIPGKGTYINATSPDGTYSLTLRDFSSEAAMPPFKEINGTIDVLKLNPVTGQSIEGSLSKIKFAE
jgi:hypothetical protein